MSTGPDAFAGQGGPVATWSPPGVPQPLTAATLDRAQKAAIIIVALGPEGAAEILRALGDRNIRRFASAVSKLNDVPTEVVEAVVDEFLAALGSDQGVRGGIDEARKFLGQVMDPDSLARVLEDIDARNGRSIWLRLADATDSAMVGWLASEHPQVATVVLAKLRSNQAARLLERFETAFAQDIVLRLARSPSPDSAAMDVLKTVAERDFVSAIERAQGSRKPAELIAGLMNHVSVAARTGFLAKMEQSDAKLAQEVQRVMFTFSDIASRVSARDIGKVVKEVEEPVLMTALKGALVSNDPTAEFVLGNISKRLSERLREDLSMMEDVRPKDGEAAMADVVNAVQALARRGEIKLIEIDAAD